MGEVNSTDQMSWRLLTIDDEPDIHDSYQDIFGYDTAYDLEEALYSAVLGDQHESESPNIPEFRLDQALSGEEGFEKVKQAVADGDPYAVILLDMRMPSGWDGLETAEMIRSLDQEVRIVISTAFMDYSLKEIRDRIGLNFEFINKPFDRNDLLQLVISLSHNWDRLREFVKKQSQSVLTESELEQFKAELARLNLAIDEHAIVTVFDADGAIIRVNDRFCQISGYEREELLGRKLREMKEGAQSAELCDDLWRIVSSGGVWHGEVRNLKKGGEESYWVQETIVPFLDKAENITKYISIQTDISKAKRIEKELIEAKELAEQANLTKDNFLASMSHELRTPLTTIIGNCELLAEQIEDREQIEVLLSIGAAGRQQLALVSDILDMSRIESGTFDIEEQSYDLSILLMDLELMFSDQASDKGLTFTISQREVEKQLLVGDVRRILQILVNLLNNALKFTKSGSVSLECWHDQQYLYFNVKDSGIGISPEVMDRLFQRFQQADSSISRQFGGSGLGLYISFNLAEMMGGYIDASSRVGEGSVFQLVLPYRPTDIQASRHGKQSGKSVERKLKGHVLVADDTPEMQLLVTRTLEGMGLTTDVVENGEMALERGLQSTFDLILMDMQMPVMDGIEATRMLRATGVHTPIVALTANVMQRHRERFFEAGCNDFLSKPIDRAAFRSVLQQYLPYSDEEVEVSENRLVIDDEMMAMFIQRIGEIKEELEAVFSGQQWEEVRMHAHNIKGFGSTFGHPELTDIGKKICDAHDLGHVEKMPKLTGKLLTMMGAVLVE